MLTPIQQSLAEQATKFVQPCLAYFLASYPCLRGVADREELESAARLACVMAARTFDAAKGQPQPYFTRAILHEMLKTCAVELQSQPPIAYRLTLETVERRIPVRLLEDAEPGEEEVLAHLYSMADEDQQWLIDHVIEGASIRKMARDRGISARQVSKLVAAKLTRLRRLCGEYP